MARESWASRFGFIMATAGFAVGLGNIWRFPYLTGTNGGGAFLLIYVLMAIFIGIPLMTAEIGLGRRAQLTPIAGMNRLTGSRTHPWNLIGWLGIGTAVFIQAYYLMLVAWIFGYFFMIASGGLSGATPEAIVERYAAFTTTPGPVIGYTLLVVILLGLIASRGLRGGLERVSTVAMPLLFVLMIALTARSLSFPGAVDGLRWYVTPDFSAITPATLMAALGQAFYSIGIGMAAAFGFGSYLNREGTDVPGNAALVVACDTAVAFLAGLVMFPALFAFGLQPDVGPGLLFLTMTNLFAQMPAGQLFGGTFFLLLILAAMTSAAALHEVLTASLTDLFAIRRRAANWLLVASAFVASVAVIMSLGPWTWLRIFGLDLFAFFDTVSGNFGLAAGGLTLSLYVVFAWGFDRFREEINAGAGRLKVTPAWKPLMVVVIPVAVAVVLAIGLRAFFA